MLSILSHGNQFFYGKIIPVLSLITLPIIGIGLIGLDTSLYIQNEIDIEYWASFVFLAPFAYMIIIWLKICFFRWQHPLAIEISGDRITYYDCNITIPVYYSDIQSVCQTTIYSPGTNRNYLCIFLRLGHEEKYTSIIGNGRLLSIIQKQRDKNNATCIYLLISINAIKESYFIITALEEESCFVNGIYPEFSYEMILLHGLPITKMPTMAP